MEEWLSSEWKARLLSGLTLTFAVAVILNNDVSLHVIDLNSPVDARFVNVCVVAAFTAGVVLEPIRSIISTGYAFIYPLIALVFVFIGEFVWVYVSKGYYISESIIGVEVFSLMWPFSFVWCYWISNPQRNKKRNNRLVVMLINNPWFIFVCMFSGVVSAAGTFVK